MEAKGLDLDLGALWARGRDFLRGGLWDFEVERGSRLRVVHALQFCVMVAQGFVRDRLFLRASALTYFTVLSVVPLLAVAVSIVGAVGVRSEQFVDFAVTWIAGVVPEAEAKLRGVLESVNFAGLGSLGAATLFVTTVLAISNIESAFNGIWGVKQARSWGRRFPDYLMVLVIAPLLGATAVSLNTALKSAWLVQRLLEFPAFATLWQFGLQYVPVVILGCAFSFLYWFLPNTSVRAVSAVLGGVTAGVLTVVAQRVYIDWGVGQARADTFFGTFAALALLFVWIYLFWAIVLFGAEIAFAHQNLHFYRREVRGRRAGPAEREAIGLRIALLVAWRFRDAAQPLDADALCDLLSVPVRTVRDVVQQLLEGEVISVRSEAGTEAGYQLARPAESIAVTEVLSSLRGPREPTPSDGMPVVGLVERVLAELDEGATKEAAGRTLADLVAELPPVSVGLEESS